MGTHLLTAGRSDDLLCAIWAGLDLGAGSWPVPGARMKGAEDRVVALSPRAGKSLEGPRLIRQSLAFPGSEADGRPLSSQETKNPAEWAGS